ncbi:MAG: APC family permease [Dehalobacterium sp.]
MAELERNLDWKQGLAISLGVPVLILPSIGYFTSYMWGFSVIIWAFSIVQGFIQNFAYGELALKYPEAAGMPGFVQEVFKSDIEREYSMSKFIGGFTAWSYWFAWNPVLAVFSLLIGSYLHGMIPLFSNVPEHILSLASGVIIFSVLIVVNWRGVSGGAVLGYILAVISIVPLIVLSIAPLVTGHFDFSNIVHYMLPVDWQWDIWHISIFFGILAMAQWSACGWETAAIYAPKYKNPRKDIPKALWACGSICILSYILVQTVCIGSLGIEAIISEPYSPMLELAKISMGKMGAFITILMLLAAMVLIIQTALLGSSIAMQSLAEEGNLPKIFGRANKHKTPVLAMMTIALLNILLISLGTPASILSASAIGYVVANGICLFAYVKASKSPQAAKEDKYFKLPQAWKYMALICGILNIPLYLIGLTVINIIDFGLTAALIGFIILLLYVPLWFYSIWEIKRQNLQAQIEKLGVH